MKILHITKKYPDALGGDAVVVSNLQKYQEAAGYQVAILTSNCKETRKGEHIYTFGLTDTPAALDQITLKRLISLVGLFFKVFIILFKERPDVIHTHSVDMAFFVSFAARLYRVPMVHTFHIVTFYDASQSVLRRKTELWFARVAGLRLVTAPNAHDVAALQKAGLRQAVLLPNGVDLEFWRPGTAAAKHKEFVFISVGRLEPQKGYPYLIRAASLLATGPKTGFRVIIVGEGSQQKYLQRLVRSRHIESVVDFVGRKTAKEVRQLLSQADAAIFTSLYETTPITLLEAWAVGLPVIMSSVGILHGVALDTDLAYLVQPRDEQSIAAAMQSCIDDEAARTRVAAAGHAEVTKYTWPCIAQIAERLYGSML
jgi:glycosyltransferase involved in cell wall biosynthesis